MYRCRKRLTELAVRYSVSVIGVLKHSDIPCNCMENEIARLGTVIRHSNEFAILGVNLRTFGHIIDSVRVDSFNERFAVSDKSRKVPKIWIKLDKTHGVVSIPDKHSE